jgi:hypothetical protein
MRSTTVKTSRGLLVGTASQSVNWKTDFMSQCKNVFEAILRYGHDEDFVPHKGERFVPTDAPAGSNDKIEVLRRRVELGQPLWHTTDRVDYSGLTGAIRPRE